MEWPADAIVVDVVAVATVNVVDDAVVVVDIATEAAADDPDVAFRAPIVVALPSFVLRVLPFDGTTFWLVFLLVKIPLLVYRYADPDRRLPSDSSISDFVHMVLQDTAEPPIAHDWNELRGKN